MIVAVAVLTFVTLQRLGELALASRNTRRLKAAGAKEYGAGHYPLIVLLHTGWLVSLWILAWDRPAEWLWLAVFAILQGLRLWVIASLGGRWTTRIIVPPDQPLVRRGPYRLISHPNYWVVAGEVAALPMAFGLPLLAAVFTVLNAALLLGVRIPAEARALKTPT